MFSLPKRDTLYLLCGQSSARSPIPWQPVVCFWSMNLPILDVLYKLNHTVHDILCLVSFTKQDVFKGYPHSFLLWLSNIPLYGCTTSVPPFIHLLMDISLVSTFWLLCIPLKYSWRRGMSLEGEENGKGHLKTREQLISRQKFSYLACSFPNVPGYSPVSTQQLQWSF